MALGQFPLVQHRLHFGRELQQSEQIRNRRPIAADQPRDLAVRQLELRRESLVARGLVDRREVVTLQILDERERQQRLVVDVFHDGRNLRPAEPRRCAPAPLARDQLEPAVPRPHQDGLQQSRRLDRRDQLVERPFVHSRTRLKRIGPHARHRQLAERARRLGLLARRRAEQRLEPAAKPPGLAHVATSGSGAGASLTGADSIRSISSSATAR